MDFGFSLSKKDMALNDSVSGVSRSGRVRKKSAKLMEMEDYHSPAFEGDFPGDASKNRKKPPAKLSSPPGSPSFAVPELKSPVMPTPKKKITFATPPIASSPMPKAAPPPSPPTPRAAPSMVASNVVVKQMEPPQSFEALSGSSSCYLMGDDIHFITGEPVTGSVDADSTGHSLHDERLAPLRLEIGAEHHGLHEDGAGLKMKFIMSPKVSGAAKPEIAGKRKGVTARRNPSELISRPSSAKKPSKANVRGSIKSPVRKRPSPAGGVMGGRRQMIPPISATLDDDMPILDREDSSSTTTTDSSDEDEEMDSLVIAEPPRLTKKFEVSNRSRHSKPKASVKQSMHGDHMGGEHLVSDGSAQPQSLYLKEKLSAKKKSGKKAVKQKEGKSEKKPRPISAYMLYCKDHRAKLLRDNPSLDFSTLSRKLGEAWKSMSDSEKLIWRRKAKNLQGKHSLIKSGGKMMLDSRKPKGSENKQQGWANARLLEDSLTKETCRTTTTTPLDVAAYLKLLGESLSIIGQRLTEHEGQIAVSGSLSVLLDSTLCALGPLTCLTSEVPEMDGCPKATQESILDNIAYVMPGL